MPELDELDRSATTAPAIYYDYFDNNILAMVDKVVGG
jgi:hypothetical protein